MLLSLVGGGCCLGYGNVCDYANVVVGPAAYLDEIARDPAVAGIVPMAAVQYTNPCPESAVLPTCGKCGNKALVAFLEDSELGTILADWHM